MTYLGQHSERWACRNCEESDESMVLVGHESTDASATESFECADCGATGQVHFFEGPDSPAWSGEVVPR
jgi:hypothetical protein